jgi:hypothetical protein
MRHFAVTSKPGGFLWGHFGFLFAFPHKLSKGVPFDTGPYSYNTIKKCKKQYHFPEVFKVFRDFGS